MAHLRRFALLAAIAIAPGLSARADWREFFGLAPEAAERPPQFVLLAFDGSLNNPFWEESLNFARANGVRFTYFMSGVYFLLDANKGLYAEPAHGPGKSEIGWGGKNPANLVRRMGYLRRAHAEGNELGSHANGHYDGRGYSYDQWKLEFAQFPKLIFGAFANNAIEPPKGFDLGFGIEDVKGFRAPHLGQNPALYSVLAEEGFRYDTSTEAPIEYWPERPRGIWNYPLGILNLAGTAKKTLSMDYNFYFAQSGGEDAGDPELRELYGRQMLQSYYNYFQSNYNGNRAPVHIGHHFSKWNGSAYWNALKAFAKDVCGLPEVRCVTYAELTDYLEARTPEELRAFARGNFPKAAPYEIPAIVPYPRGISLSIAIGSLTGETVALALNGRDAAAIASDPALGAEWKLDGTPIGSGLAIPTSEIRKLWKPKSVLSVALSLGKLEILRTTRKIADLPPAEGIVLEKFDYESRALQGDLPEAHFDRGGES